MYDLMIDEKRALNADEKTLVKVKEKRFSFNNIFFSLM